MIIKLILLFVTINTSISRREEGLKVTLSDWKAKDGQKMTIGK